MKTAFCTISTSDYLFKSYTLFDSVSRYYETDFYCLVTDSKSDIKIKSEYTTLPLSEMNHHHEFRRMSDKYSGDKLRWALKPVLLKYLLENGYDAVIYCDNDIYFFSSSEFLFDILHSKSFLLTPHNYNSSPEKNQNWLEANFRVGLYNAGFIGVSQKGIDILKWWTECCIYNLKKSAWRGLFDDQKYLDLVPVLFDDVVALKHKGCNFAGWNYTNYKLERTENNMLVINDDFGLVFIHFADLSMRLFSGDNSFVNKEYQDYLMHLKNYKPDFRFRSRRYSISNALSFFNYIRWKIIRLFE